MLRATFRLAVAAVTVGLGVVASAVPADAHPLHYGDDASNWVSQVASVQPAGAVHAAIGDGVQRITVSLGTARSVIVDGTDGAPFLLLRPEGAWLNDAGSATAAPQWKRVSHTPSWSWHDTRTHWPGYTLPPPVEAQPGDRQHVLDWHIAMRVDGTTGAIAGTLDWVPGPSGGNGAAIATVAFAIVLGLSLLTRRRVVLGGALVALVAVDVVHSAGMVAGRVGAFGNKLAALPGHGGLPLALWLFAVGTVFLLVRRRDFGLYAAAMLAMLFCFTEALPSLGVLWHSQAVNSLPTSTTRALVAALTGASAATAVAAVLVIVRTARSPIDGGAT